MKSKIVLLFSLLAFWGCDEEKKASPVYPEVSVSAVNPAEASKGEIVTLEGANFGLDSIAFSVSFNKVVGKIISIADNRIEVEVPENGRSGPLELGYAGQNQVIADSFYIVKEPLSPEITVLQPTDVATAGEIVIITGKNFSIFPTKNIVTFKGAYARVVNATPTELRVEVPGDALTGDVVVTTLGKVSNAVAYNINSSLPTADGRLYWSTFYSTGVNGLSYNTYLARGKDNTRDVPGAAPIYTEANENKIVPKGENLFVFPVVMAINQNTNKIYFIADTRVYDFSLFTVTGGYQLAEVDIATGVLTYLTIGADFGNNITITNRDVLVDHGTGDIYFVGTDKTLTQYPSPINSGCYKLMPGSTQAVLFSTLTNPTNPGSTYATNGTFERLSAITKDRVFFTRSSGSTRSLRSYDKFKTNQAGNSTDLRIHFNINAPLMGENFGYPYFRFLLPTTGLDNVIYYMGGREGFTDYGIYKYDFDTDERKALYTLVDGFVNLNINTVGGDNLYFMSFNYNDPLSDDFYSGGIPIYRLKTDGSSLSPQIVYQDARSSVEARMDDSNLLIDTID